MQKKSILWASGYFPFWFMKKLFIKKSILPRFLTFRPWFLHQECSANLKNGWLCVHKHCTWNYFPPDEEISNFRFVLGQNSCVKPKRLVNLHHVLISLTLDKKTDKSYQCRVRAVFQISTMFTIYHWFSRHCKKQRALFKQLGQFSRSSTKYQ